MKKVPVVEHSLRFIKLSKMSPNVENPKNSSAASTPADAKNEKKVATKPAANKKNSNKETNKASGNVKAKNLEIKKALAAKKAALKGKNSKIARLPRYKPRFYLPKTLKLPRNPKYPRKALNTEPALNDHCIFRAYIKSDKSMLLIDHENTIVFTCDIRANKGQIKSAARALLGHNPESVRTLIGINGKKKAYVKMPQDVAAPELAAKLGII